jgi:galactokinase
MDEEIRILITRINVIEAQGRVAINELKRLETAPLTLEDTKDAVLLLESAVSKLTTVSRHFERLFPVWKAANMLNKCEWTEAILRKKVAEYREGIVRD